MKIAHAAVGVVVSALGLHATADVVEFDNTDGTFVWTYSSDLEGDGTHLDITQPASQSGAPGAETFSKWFYSSPATPHWETSWIQSHSSKVLTDDEPTFLNDDDNIPTPFMFMREMGIGEEIGPDKTFGAAGYVWVSNYYADPVVDESIDMPSYLGVSIMIDGQTHYGWIYLGEGFKPERWAYETEPNTPVVIVPAPGVASVLVGAGLLGVRRRRHA